MFYCVYLCLCFNVLKVVRWFLLFYDFLIKQVCRSSLLSGRNVRWPRGTLLLVSHVEYALRVINFKVRKIRYKRTDGRTPYRYTTLASRRDKRNNVCNAVVSSAI